MLLLFIINDKYIIIGTMYIKKTKRNYKDKTYTNYLLVQAIHTPKGPRQKTICSLGDLRARPPQEWLKLAHKVQDALLGQSHLFDNTDEEVRKIVRRVKAKEFSILIAMQEETLLILLATTLKEPAKNLLVSSCQATGIIL